LIVENKAVIPKHCLLSRKAALAGFVKIEEQYIIGINATIIDSIFIFGRTQIGVETIVIKIINTEGLYVGNPQRQIK
jgi:carbonic anhydrase/acetyltransferase-like protein (isoleucine patch superfamily)